MAQRNNAPQMSMNGKGGGPGRGHASMRGGEKPKDIKITLSKLLKYLGFYKFAIFGVMILAACSSFFQTLTPKFIGDATDVIYNAVESGITTGTVVVDYQALIRIMLTMIVLAIFAWTFSAIQGFSMSKIASEVTYKLRKDIDEKINRLPLSYFDKTPTGDVLSRITNDVDSITDSLRESLIQLASTITLLVSTIVIMLSISVQLTIVALIMVPTSMFMITRIVKISQPLYRKQQKSLGMLNGHIEEMLSSHLVVKSFNMEEQSVEDFNIYNEELRKNAWKSQVASHLMMPLSVLIANIAYIVVCIMGAQMAVNKVITVGNISSFIQYIRNLNNPIQQLANISTMLQSALACSERVFEFLDEEEQEEEKPVVTDTTNITGNVKFENVGFGYVEGKPIINDFSLEVKPGDKIAIVGPTGAGKTTIVKLLMRYYEINKGNITIDGINIRDFSRKDLRSMFGMVLQDTWLFKGSIKDNILYSRPDASFEEVKAASKIGQVHHFVKTLANGYDFELNEESSNISQGQKQLLTIARAFLQNPKILILDEATSSVDTRTEVLIQKAMEKLMENRTSFVIAHRLSTIRDADKIIVMNMGDIVETGNHNELLEKGGFYANLYQSQFENSED